MSIEIVKQNCTGCGACVNICPKTCIKMIRDRDGFLYPTIGDNCIKCSVCENVCPVLNPVVNKTGIKNAYAIYNCNESIRVESSSGGFFSLVANYVIENGGAVFGAAFNKDFSVSHKCVEQVEKLQDLRGSKYVQSDTGSTFETVKTKLDSGQYVLYTGTPCQIEGLTKYLQKSYDKLITMDLVCHGVPSPGLWEDYVNLRESEINAKTESVNFRLKEPSWVNYSIYFSFSNGKCYCESKDKDLFMQCFLKDLCLRPSCYSCQFKKNERSSDFTVADYWGVQKELPEFFDDKGISLVITNSQKAQDVLCAISEGLICKKTDLSKAVNHNPAYYRSVFKPMYRDYFMRSKDEFGIEKSYNLTVKKIEKRKNRDKLFNNLLIRPVRQMKKRIKNLRLVIGCIINRSKKNDS